MTEPIYNSPPIRIRILHAGDLAAVLNLTRLVPEAPWWSEGHVRQLIDPAPATGPDFRRGWGAEAAGVTGTDAGNGLLGFLVLHALRIETPVPILECEIESIVVHPEVRRRGVGQLLLQTALAWCRERRASTVRLEVRCSNLAAIRLYESAGFVATGARPRYYESPPEDALLMEHHFFLSDQESPP